MKDSISIDDPKMEIKSEVVDNQENSSKIPKNESDQQNDGDQKKDDKQMKPVKCENLNTYANSENGQEMNSKSDNSAVEQDLHSSTQNAKTLSRDGIAKIMNDIPIDSDNMKPKELSNKVKDDTSVTKTRKRRRPRTRNRKQIKKSKLEAMQLPDTETVINVVVENISSPDAIANRDDVEYCLTVTNLPNNWSFMDIKNFIDMQCGPVDEIEMIKDDKSSNGAIRLTYQNEDGCKKAMMKLKNKEIEGTKLSISMIVLELSDSEMRPDTPEPPEVRTLPKPETSDTNNPERTDTWRPDLDVWDIDPKGTYGLKESFLKSLHIIPPLDKWVYVLNFRCDKHELRDVLELCGTVVQCSIFMLQHRYANVMYSHPLEAVQAVSMLNGKYFYGQKLKVTMLRNPSSTVILPKGLAEIGAGLGANGRPLRTVAKHYRRLVASQTSSLNTDAFEVNSHENLVGNQETFEVKNVLNHEFETKESSINNEANSETKINTTKALVPADGKASVPSPGTKSPETNTGSGLVLPTTHDNVSKSKTQVNTPQTLLDNKKLEMNQQKPTPTPIKSLIRQQTPQYTQQNSDKFGPRPLWSGSSQDPRMLQFSPGPGWNGPRPMQGPRPMGPMQGPRPMGPMQGPRPMDPMQGPRPMGLMQGPRPMGPMQGPRPMGPMQGPIPMGPMQGPRPIGHMQGPGPIQGPSPMGSMQGPGHVGPMHGAGPMGPMQGPGHVGPMQGPGHVGPMHGAGPMGPMQVPSSMIGVMQGPIGQGYGNLNEPVQLHLSNLSPSTTFATLCEKMATCGQIISIQLTTPGCAVVTFANRMQANNCFQTYNNFCIDNYIVQVKYM